MTSAETTGDVLCCKGTYPPSEHKDKTSFEFLSDHEYFASFFAYDSNSASADDVNYSRAWYTHYKRRERLFNPWLPSMGSYFGDWEPLRLQAIGNFWRCAKMEKISPVTIHLAVWILNKLLHCSLRQGMTMTREWFAGIVAVGFRIALKFEERPDALWGIRKIWDVLPMFEAWNTIDRRNQFLMKVESEALRMLDDLMDVPLAVQFFDLYVVIGGWPSDLRKEYVDLGHYLLALSSFARSDDNLLSNVPPSVLAAAAVVLAVKIVNGDSRRCYEFFPERFAVFCSITMKELQPSIKGLTRLLRRKPAGSEILARVYPGWGEHEWQ